MIRHRSDRGLKPHFIKVELPTDADITEVYNQPARQPHVASVRDLQVGTTPAGYGYYSLLNDELAPWPLLSHSASPLESGPTEASRIGSGFGYASERPARRVPAVPVSTVLPSTPTPRFQNRVSVGTLDSVHGQRRERPERQRKMPMATSFIPLPNRGLTAQPA